MSGNKTIGGELNRILDEISSAMNDLMERVELLEQEMENLYEDDAAEYGEAEDVG